MDEFLYAVVFRTSSGWYKEKASRLDFEEAVWCKHIHERICKDRVDGCGYEIITLEAFSRLRPMILKDGTVKND